MIDLVDPYLNRWVTKCEKCRVNSQGVVKRTRLLDVFLFTSPQVITQSDKHGWIKNLVQTWYLSGWGNMNGSATRQLTISCSLHIKVKSMEKFSSKNEGKAIQMNSCLYLKACVTRTFSIVCHLAGQMPALFPSRGSMFGQLCGRKFVKHSLEKHFQRKENAFS